MPLVWRGRPIIDADLVLRLYLDGLSTRQIAAVLHISHSSAARFTRGLRSRSDAVYLRYDREGRGTHWRSLRATARRLTEKELGRKLDPLEYVHHVNGDPADQRPVNRVVMLASEHGRLHALERWRKR
jgi:hypothetical protein